MAATETQTDTIEERHIKVLWAVLRDTEKKLERRGLQFGGAMYEYRENHSAQGRRTDFVSSETKLETFEEFCDRLSIPRATAYRWIAKYEEFLGTRPAKNTEVKKSEPTASKTIEPEPEPTPTRLVTKDEQNRDSLKYLAKQIRRMSETIQQVVREKAKWSKYREEYAEVVSPVENLIKFFKLL